VVVEICRMTASGNIKSVAGLLYIIQGSSIAIALCKNLNCWACHAGLT
jgi:hypothetical protein